MDNNDNGCGVGDALNSPEVGENLQSSDQQFPEIEILEELLTPPVNDECDIFGNSLVHQWKFKVECPKCHRTGVEASRFAAHLSECMNLGRRSARARVAQNGAPGTGNAGGMKENGNCPQPQQKSNEFAAKTSVESMNGKGSHEKGEDEDGDGVAPKT